MNSTKLISIDYRTVVRVQRENETASIEVFQRQGTGEEKTLPAASVHVLFKAEHRREIIEALGGSL